MWYSVFSSLFRGLHATHSLNSGVTLYFPNSSSHSAGDKGGRIPVIGRHSVMLKPDSVRRVTPPTTITAKTKVDDKRSHRPTEGGDNTKTSSAGGILAEKKRPSRARSRGGNRVRNSEKWRLVGVDNTGMEPQCFEVADMCKLDRVGHGPRKGKNLNVPTHPNRPFEKPDTDADDGALNALFSAFCSIAAE
jgi:hypothetical protein